MMWPEPEIDALAGMFLFGLMIYKACFEKLYRIIAYKDHIV